LGLRLGCAACDTLAVGFFYGPDGFGFALASVAIGMIKKGGHALVLPLLLSFFGCIST